MLNYPLLSDYKREVIKTYGIELPNFAGLKDYTTSKRAIFILDKDGIVRYAWITDNPAVEPTYGEIERFLEKMA